MRSTTRQIFRSIVLSSFLLPASLLAQGTTQGTSGMFGNPPTRGMQGIPYVTNPYGGMFGSMGNVYSPYYRRFHQYGMAGPLTGLANPSGAHYIVNPYSGMYGSMGNVYSPYYRQFHQPGMSGMGGASGPGSVQRGVVRYHYPYFLPPTMGAM